LKLRGIFISNEIQDKARLETKSVDIDMDRSFLSTYFIMFCDRRRPSEEALTASVSFGSGFLSPAESRGVPGKDAGKLLGELLGKINSPLSAFKPPAVLSQYRSDRQVLKKWKFIIRGSDLPFVAIISLLLPYP
jgi:hypothetical protein